MATKTGRWNHNIHYHPVIFDAIHGHPQRALDVGCGEGTLARELRAVVPQVTAIDADPASINLARQQDNGSRIDYLLGDFLTFPFEPNSFDVIASVATLHHMDAEVALSRMRDLLRPGGTMAIIGLARPDLPADLPFVLAAAIATQYCKITKTYWEHRRPQSGHPRRPTPGCACSPVGHFPASDTGVISSGATRSPGQDHAVDTATGPLRIDRSAANSVAGGLAPEPLST